MMTEEELKEIERRLDNWAAPPPHTMAAQQGTHNYPCAMGGQISPTRAQRDMRALLDEVKRLRGVETAHRELLARWSAPKLVALGSQGKKDGGREQP